MRSISVGVCTLLLCSSCATMSNKTKNLLLISGAASVGATVGALTSPQGESTLGHAMLWGGLAAAGAGTVGILVNDDTKKLEEFQRQLEVAKKENAALKGEAATDAVDLEAQTTPPIGKDFPSEYKHLVQPGKWAIYKLNKWVMHGENTIIHQDKMIRLIPPSLMPKEQVLGKNEKENNDEIK